MPILGSEATSSGALTRGQLRWNYRRLHHDVYVLNSTRPSTLVNAYGAWLATGRTGIVTGLAAARLLGAQTVPADTEVEIIADGHRQRRGMLILNESIADDEIQPYGSEGLRVTTPARTALEIARRLPRDAAVPHLDALAANSRLTARQAERLAVRYRGTRNIRQARESLALLDGGAACPEETRVRLLLHDGGLPPPATDITVHYGEQVARIAMGWPKRRVGIAVLRETKDNPTQENHRHDLLQRLRWIELRVLPHDSLQSTVYRVFDALYRWER